MRGEKCSINDKIKDLKVITRNRRAFFSNQAPRQPTIPSSIEILAKRERQNQNSIDIDVFRKYQPEKIRITGAVNHWFPTRGP